MEKTTNTLTTVWKSSHVEMKSGNFPSTMKPDCFF